MSVKLTVNVNEGKVRGIKKTSEFSNAEYYSFFGVPYGHNTGGTMRFKDPVPIKPWKNILDATVEKKVGCIQFSTHYKCIYGTEDCLFNNIHTPGIPSKDDPLKAVIVDIHPGSLNHGSPETKYYGSPDYVMHLDVVYVCIAYRLHILGFLNLNVPGCSGNQGLKDIILGLRWIKDNIRAFGGDPDNVTLLGNSSGATIIHQLMLSPSAKGLFHKVVMMGGYNFTPSRICNEENATLCYDLAQNIGYNETDETDTKKLLSFYRKIPPEMTISMVPQRIVNRIKGTPLPSSLFMPTVDAGKNSVLPVHHRNLIDTTSRVPILFGICENEAFMGFCKGFKDAVQQNFFTAIRHNFFGWGYDITDREIEYIKEQVEDFYCDGNPIETAPLSLQIDIQTDIMYSDVYQTLLDIVAKDLPSSVFVYKFTFNGNACTLREKLVGLIDDEIEGTVHADDFAYWAKTTHRWDPQDRELTPETNEMIHTFTQIVGTFAKTGNPNGKHLKLRWDPSTIENPCYMKIDKDMKLIPGKLNGKRMEFWENLKRELKRE